MTPTAALVCMVAVAIKATSACIAGAAIIPPTASAATTIAATIASTAAPSLVAAKAPAYWWRSVSAVR